MSQCDTNILFVSYSKMKFVWPPALAPATFIKMMWNFGFLRKIWKLIWVVGWILQKISTDGTAGSPPLQTSNSPPCCLRGPWFPRTSVPGGLLVYSRREKVKKLHYSQKSSINVFFKNIVMTLCCAVYCLDFILPRSSPSRNYLLKFCIMCLWIQGRILAS